MASVTLTPQEKRAAMHSMNSVVALPSYRGLVMDENLPAEYQKLFTLRQVKANVVGKIVTHRHRRIDEY